MDVSVNLYQPVRPDISDVAIPESRNISEQA